MAVNFSEILQKQTATIEKPKPLPVGTYLCNNPTLPVFKGIGKQETPAAEFQLVVLAPQDDVDQDELRSFGEVVGKKIRHLQFLSENALFRSKEELVNAFNLEEEEKSLGQLYNETVNAQVLVTVKHRPSDDGTEMYTEVEKLAAV